MNKDCCTSNSLLNYMCARCCGCEKYHAYIKLGEILKIKPKIKNMYSPIPNLSVYKYVYMYVCAYVCVYMCQCICGCMYECMCMYLGVCMGLYICVCVDACMSVYVCMWVYLCVYECICICVGVCTKEGNILFNDTLNTLHLRLYNIRHMIKNHSYRERGNPLPPHRLLFLISSKGSFICIIQTQDNTYHSHGALAGIRNSQQDPP